MTDATRTPKPPVAAYRIGDLAERTGRSVHAIRWYESQGLMPGVARDAAGRRVYSELHLGWIDLMDRLRRTGMSIAEMRAYTELAVQGKATLAQRRELLAAHRERVRQMVAEWTLALKLIDSKVEFYSEWMADGHRPRLNPTERAGVAPPVAGAKKPQRATPNSKGESK